MKFILVLLGLLNAALALCWLLAGRGEANWASFFCLHASIGFLLQDAADRREKASPPKRPA